LSTPPKKNSGKSFIKNLNLLNTDPISKGGTLLVPESRTGNTPATFRLLSRQLKPASSLAGINPASPGVTPDTALSPAPGSRTLVPIRAKQEEIPAPHGGQCSR
jgi:hypothetical protein